MISKEFIIAWMIVIGYLMLALNYGNSLLTLWYSGLLVGFLLCWTLLEIWEDSK